MLHPEQLQGDLPLGLAIVVDISTGLRQASVTTPVRAHQTALSASFVEILMSLVSETGGGNHPRGHHGQNIPRSLPYQRELALLRHVLAKAKPGNAASAAAAVDDFGRELGEAGGWAKFAGGSKAAVLLAAMQGGPPADHASTSETATGTHTGISAGVLEIGTYCGNSALRLAAALPGVRVTTLELDPVLVAIARALIAFAGLAFAVDVWTGHSKLVLPRLAGKMLSRLGSHVRPSFSAILLVCPSHMIQITDHSKQQQNNKQTTTNCS
ncbi:unnamed protein product [Polarella glacialis]|uniref:catechol O-methyltransferase n=1 Tax=Polarella glacialis TaxID=89957 RepID=A0A813I7S7_POLGL|nr:unnamed protein product [Polarella glacialis]